MTTLSQQKNKDMEKFDEKFPVIDWRGYPARNTIKSHISQIYINIAKNEIERLERQKITQDDIKTIAPKYRDDLIKKQPYHNQILQNQINYWEGQLKELQDNK